jgi:hypothetical protein
MAASGSKTLPTIGFFTVTEDAEAGFVGGLLVLNAAGRPLEFHCTAPLKPNRAQQILYGSTLRPFLYGEQIGATLASKAKSDTLFLCTDVEPAMCLRDSIHTPLVLLFSSDDEQVEPVTDAGNPRSVRFDSPHETPRPAFAKLAAFKLGPHSVAVLVQHKSDRELVQERWSPYADHLDLREPFCRIREALDEAQRGATK